MRHAMAATRDSVARGVLDPVAARSRFSLTLHPPSAELAGVVDRHWVVRWDLNGREPFTQDVLPHPCVNLVFEAERSGIFGIPTRRFRREITGAGAALGTRLRPGGLSLLSDVEAWELTDAVRSLSELLGPPARELQRTVLSHDDIADGMAPVESFLRKRLRPLDPGAQLVQEVIDSMLSPVHDATVAELAGRHGVVPRTLQRLFRRYVGVGPKWVLQRYRMHEAAERMLVDPDIDLARLALDLGYADQAHFGNDFHARTGRTPAAYLAACAEA
jgi:AraC-like DNA-binding protein